MTDRGRGPRVRGAPVRWPALLVLGFVGLVVLGTGCQWAGFRYDATLNAFNPETNLNATNGTTLVSKFRVAVGPTGPVVGTSNGIVGKATDGTLYGASRDGVAGCSGTPIVCLPLWTAATNTTDTWVSLHGPFALTTYRTTTSGPTRIADFDAVSMSNCTGAPAVCSPGWMTDAAGPSISGATIGGSFLYVTDGANLRVYDVDGIQNCTTGAAPRICSPLWTGPALLSQSQPAIAGSKVFVPTANGITVFDADGVTNCAGAPKVCQPLFRADVATSPSTVSATADRIVTFGTAGLTVIDAHGVSACSAGVCGALWTAPVSALKGRPAIANGRILLQQGLGQSRAEAYDLAGVDHCTTGAFPHTCTPLWTHALGVEIPVVADTIAVNNLALFERYTGTSSGFPDGDLYVEALDQATGTLRFATPPGLGFVPPTVGDGRVYLTNQDGVQVLGQP